MPRRIAISTLNASTVDILNVIRANAPDEYRNLVPEIAKATDIPMVGQIIYDHPAIANQFVNALVNRIAAVRIKSANFNNQYSDLKKGFLEYGEVVEEVFVELTRVREFSADKAEKRELKRSLPDIRSVFHCINWRVQYPVTIQNQDLMHAFTSEQGVLDLIARIVDSVYTAAEYDEFLLFKYLIIKGILGGKMTPIVFNGSQSITEAAVTFRATSNNFTMMSDQYNAAKVHTTTPKQDQYIFMDSLFNAKYDVNILASAFNMGKADFEGRLKLIDSFTTFDNDRFKNLFEEGTMVEPVTPEELAQMANVRAILVDREWFQVYDNRQVFEEKYVAAGSYWNYFYNVFKTVSTSPYSNAVVFIDSTTPLPAAASLKYIVSDKSTADGVTVIALVPDRSTGFIPTDGIFNQTQDATEKAIAIQKYGAIIYPSGQTTTTVDVMADGVTYTATVASTLNVGDTVTFNQSASTSSIDGFDCVQTGDPVVDK